MALSLLATISETTVLCLICFAAVIGNVSLFLIIYKNRNIRTITNMYILNLAAADLLISVLSMPVTLVTIIKERWVFGDTACVILGFFTILSFIATVMSLGMIAINRYFYIVKWNTYPNTFSKKKALLYGAAVWFVSISLASPPLFGWAEYSFIPGKSYCFVFWPSNVYYMYFMIAVCFFGPLSTMAFSYYNILMFTRNAKRKVNVLRNNLTPTPLQPHVATISNETQNNSDPFIIEVDRNTEARSLQMNRENDSKSDIMEEDFSYVVKPHMNGSNESELISNLKQPSFQLTQEEVKITNTFILAVAVFMICWTLFAVTMFFDVYYPRPLPRAVDIMSLLLGYLNSMCNPILYGVRNSAFKQGFLNLYSRLIPKRLRPESVKHSVNSPQANRDVPGENLEAGKGVIELN